MKDNTDPEQSPCERITDEDIAPGTVIEYPEDLEIVVHEHDPEDVDAVFYTTLWVPRDGGPVVSFNQTAGALIAYSRDFNGKLSEDCDAVSEWV